MSVDVIEQYRQTEADWNVAHAKAVVKHRGEGDEYIVKALAAVDCEAEFRAYMTALSDYEQWNVGIAAESHKAAAEYHRSWASKPSAWAEK